MAIVDVNPMVIRRSKLFTVVLEYHPKRTNSKKNHTGKSAYSDCRAERGLITVKEI
jgi:hypothetical protein